MVSEATPVGTFLLAVNASDADSGVSGKVGFSINVNQLVVHYVYAREAS